MANEQNLSQVDTNVTSKAALITDLNKSYIPKEAYSHARNAVRNSKEGDLGVIGNEPSNEKCWSTPYPFCGSVLLPDDTVLVFSGDGTNSEIGIANNQDCSYKTVSKLAYNFTTAYPVTGVAKKHFQKGTIVTFTDKNNPVRRVELKTLSKVSNIDETLLWKKINQPNLSIKKGQIGNVPNGVYSVAVAYVVDNNVFSDYYSITNRVMLYSETGSNSFDVSISNLDTEFKQFAVVVIGNYIDPVTKGVTKVAKKIGNYSTKIKSFSITDFINSTYEEVSLDKLVIKKKSWQKAGIISSNSNYLMLADLVARPEQNYQLKAMGIGVEYVVKQVPADYYEFDGEDISLYRDENYDLYIHGIYNTGEETDGFHIPGRLAKSSDLTIVSSVDAYEYDQQFNDCEPPGKVPTWKVYNTAGKMVELVNPFQCDQRELGYGEMGYFESTELYADNKAMFGKWANTPIRYHKVPDESIVPRTSIVNGKTYINIIGIRLKNVPKFDDPDIIGYKITRSDRKGGNGTVVARGIMTNTRYYDDKQFNQKVLYSNYTVNDLSPDVYLSSTQTVYRSNQEHNFTPLTGYYKDKFNFYSPHTMYEPRYSLGNELKVECEEIAEITGQFEKVYNHPRAKLLNQFAFWISAAAGFIESSLVITGKGTHTYESETDTSVTAGKRLRDGQDFKLSTFEDLVSLDIPAFIMSKALGTDPIGAVDAIKSMFAILESLAIKIPYSILSGIRQADELLNIIFNFTGYTDYVYQYNAHAEFNKSIPVTRGNKRRRLLRDYKYIPSDVVSVEDGTFNNYFREKSVFLQLNHELKDPTVKDTSRNTISGFGICSDIHRKVKSVGSAYYVTSKVQNPNQYGKLGSSLQVSMHGNVIPFSEGKSPIIFGGDCIITRFQMQKRMKFFNQSMANTNWDDGTEYDYRMYRNIAYPRFWMDTSKYDFSALLSSNVVNFSKFSRTTTSKHNLDCKKRTDGGSVARIDDAYMYLSNNCVLDFFVECDYNIAFREKTEKPFYSKNNTNLSLIFRSDNVEFPEEFNISRAYSDIYTTEIFVQQQRDDFDPNDPLPVNQPNSVIYSLPSFNLQEVDNWQYFLPANFFAFADSDFGTLSGIHKLDQDRLIFLFSKSSPYISMGRDFLQLEGSGRKVTIGDGGLFAQDPREIMPTDNNYGACTSKYAFSNTHLGRLYPSSTQGRLLNFTESLDDISRQGISYWCKTYMPIFLYDYFPSYPKEENPIAGVGYMTAFDSFYETFYVTKRDFSPKKEYAENITWNGKNFLYKDRIISLRDTNYFNDISWTLSYSPADKSFVSWHDWHPDWIIQTDNHFMTVKGNTAWKHNERWDSFCNFYGADYPFEIQPVSSSGQQVEVLRSLEYILEVYKYKNFGRDRFHVLNTNFDRMFVKNTEQISPMLNLHLASENPELNLAYPRKNGKDKISFDVLYFKEENKYRINQFWDSVKDRGEFSKAEAHLFATDESGYKGIINPAAINLDKLEEQRKKFRHYLNEVRFIRTASGENKFLFKLANYKKLISPR